MTPLKRTATIAAHMARALHTASLTLATALRSSGAMCGPNLLGDGRCHLLTNEVQAAGSPMRRRVGSLPAPPRSHAPGCP